MKYKSELLCYVNFTASILFGYLIWTISPYYGCHEPWCNNIYFIELLTWGLLWGILGKGNLLISLLLSYVGCTLGQVIYLIIHVWPINTGSTSGAITIGITFVFTPIISTFVIFGGIIGRLLIPLTKFLKNRTK